MGGGRPHDPGHGRRDRRTKSGTDEGSAGAAADDVWYNEDGRAGCANTRAWKGNGVYVVNEENDSGQSRGTRR